MKFIYSAFVCLSVVGGLINCTPVSPIFTVLPKNQPLPTALVEPSAYYPELVLPKKQPLSTTPLVEMAKKLEEVLASLIPSTEERKEFEEIEGLKEYLENEKRLKNAEIPVDASYFDKLSNGDDLSMPLDFAKETKQDEPSVDSESESTEPKTRMRRTPNTPATLVVQKRGVEPRYQEFDQPPQSLNKGEFVKQTGFGNLAGLDGSPRPVIVIIERAKLNLQSANSDDDDCDGSD